MHRRLIATLVPVLLILSLAGCAARQEYPPGYTDVDLWQGPPIRQDTEVPDQYPDGTTRDALELDAVDGGGDAAH